MVTYAVDTNVLVRWLERDDLALAAQADSFFESVEPASILLDRLVLAETAYVLKSNYKLNKQQVVANLLAVAQQPYFAITDSKLVQEMLEMYRDNPPLSLEDAWLLALKRSRRVRDVFTFDIALHKRLADTK